MPLTDLRDEALRSACETAVLEALETMFFELTVAKAEVIGGSSQGARIGMANFGGSLTGALCVAVSDGCPRRMAAEFLGLEDDQVGEPQEQSMVAELANVLCGATMSRVEPSGHLRIEQPVLGAAPANCQGPWLMFPLANGSLEVTVYYGEPS